MFRPFELVEPASLTEALACLESYPEEARAYAGGSELLLMMRLGLLYPKLLVNLKSIPGLNRLRLENGHLKLGSLVTHREVETSPVVKEHFALIAQMESKVANVRVRNVGTLGGNLAFAEPHSDPATLFLIYNAQIALQSSKGHRNVPLTEFFVGPYETVMGPGELLTGIDIPPLPDGMRGAYIRWGVLERPTLNVAIGVELGDKGVLNGVRIAVGSVGAVPTRMTELEGSLCGVNLEVACERIVGSGATIQEQLGPVSDLHGSEEYKVYMTKVLLQRALREAAGEIDHG